VDAADLADPHIEDYLEFAIASVRRHAQVNRQQGTDRVDCLEYGEPIPAARRRAVPGCRLCIGCATVAEHGGRLLRGPNGEDQRSRELAALAASGGRVASDWEG